MHTTEILIDSKETEWDHCLLNSPTCHRTFSLHILLINQNDFSSTSFAIHIFLVGGGKWYLAYTLTFLSLDSGILCVIRRIIVIDLNVCGSKNMFEHNSFISGVK